jgi:hypothetical protein
MTSRREAMMKLIQICASQNDLFGLDGEGHVYQYNFNTNGWMRIGLGRSAPGGGPAPHRDLKHGDGRASGVSQ